ncbi:hypothetical protein O9992_09215 [Vibrio lentus]|nr:hypothetical protein [Vibrio lentus]
MFSSRTLNASKGPCVRATQSNKLTYKCTYKAFVQNVLENTPNPTLFQQQSVDDYHR